MWVTSSPFSFSLPSGKNSYLLMKHTDKYNYGMDSTRIQLKKKQMFYLSMIFYNGVNLKTLGDKLEVNGA